MLPLYERAFIYITPASGAVCQKLWLLCEVSRAWNTLSIVQDYVGQQFRSDGEFAVVIDQSHRIQWSLPVDLAVVLSVAAAVG